MLQGYCVRCTATYFGWSLMDPSNRVCDICGQQLVLSRRPRHVGPYSEYRRSGDGLIREFEINSEIKNIKEILPEQLDL